MKPQTTKNKDNKKLFIPEAYVIDQLRKKRPERHSSGLQTIWDQDLEGHMPLERPKRDEAPEGLIIIEI